MTTPLTRDTTASSQRPHEPEHQGPLWKHPYFLYVILTAVLFGILLIAGYIAYHNDLIPNRRIEDRQIRTE